MDSKLVKIGFFWGPSKEHRKQLWNNRWSLRGFYFYRNGSYINVHYKALAMMYGSDLKNKWINFKRDWITTLTLGKVNR